MTLKAYRANARLLKSLYGETCSQALIGYPWSIMLRFGAIHIPADRDDVPNEKGLTSDCPWRLETSKNVIVASREQSDESMKERIQICVGARVESIRVFRPSFMLRVQFDIDLALWLFPEDSRDYQVDRQDKSIAWWLSGYAYTDSFEDVRLIST